MKKLYIGLIIVIILIITISIFIINSLPKNHFSLGEPTILSTDIGRFNSQREVDITKTYEERGRVLNINIPIEQSSSLKNVKANIRCLIPGYSLFETIQDKGNQYSFESFEYKDVDFAINGYAYFTGTDTVFNLGSNRGTEILSLKKNSKASLNVDLVFKGQDPQNVDCYFDVVSKNPAYSTSKKIVFNYPGIEGFTIFRED